MDSIAYDEGFEAKAYLRERFLSADANVFRTFPLPHLYEFYRSLGSRNLKVLEVATGPTIAYVISAAPYASEIVLSEYVEDNRKAIQQWVDRDPQAFDWTPFLKHVVVDIEGGEEKDIPVREESLRSSIKAVVPCDARKDPLLPTEYMRQYDVVQSMVSLECIVRSRNDFLIVMTRVAQVLKPGGKLVLYHVEKDTIEMVTYMVGSKEFPSCHLSKEIITDVLASTGFTDVKRIPCICPPEIQFRPDDPKVSALYIATRGMELTNFNNS